MSWKREEIPDHKFDYVDVDSFVDNSLIRKTLYSSVFIYALKGIITWMLVLYHPIESGDFERVVFSYIY